MSVSRRAKPRELTGRAVLLWLLGFFGVVFAVNAVMVKAATSTFGGVETMSSYKAGLQFKDEEAKAERQDELRWHIDGTIVRDRFGEAVLDLVARDTKGAPIERATIRCVLETSTTLTEHDSAGRGIRIASPTGFAVGDYMMIGSEIIQVEAMPRGPDDDFFFFFIDHAAGYVRAGVGGWYAINSRVTAYANVENALDRRYNEVVGSPALPVNFRAGFRFRIGGE